MTLVALTALLVGGVGVANAVASHLARKREAIATMKTLGATGAGVFAVYCTQIMIVALFATLVGAGLGAALPYAIVSIFGAMIPLPVELSLSPAVLMLSIAYGLLTAFAFALWPLGRAHDISVSSLFRDQIAAERSWPRPRYVVATVITVAALAGLAILFSYDRRLAAIFVGSAGLVFIALWLIAHVDYGDSAPLATRALDRAAACDRQHSPARRLDAERGAFAGSRLVVAGDSDRDRRQSASSVRVGLAGACTVVLLPGYSVGRCRSL